MSEVRLDLEEFKAALNELEARGKPGSKIVVKIEDRKLIMSCVDRNDNILEAIIYSNGNLCAQFRHTERLMFMKKKGEL